MPGMFSNGKNPTGIVAKASRPRHALLLVSLMLVFPLALILELVFLPINFSQKDILDTVSIPTDGPARKVNETAARGGALEDLIPSGSEGIREFVKPMRGSDQEENGQSVTWKGRVLDFTGHPMQGIVVALEARRKGGYRKIASAKTVKFRSFVPSASVAKWSVTRSVRIPESEPYFYFMNLEPGTYRVSVRTGSFRYGSKSDHVFADDRITFEHPGLVEKDLIVMSPGAIVQGRVLEEGTGIPIKADRPRITVYRQGKKTSYESVDVDRKNGSYCIRWLPEGTYDFCFKGEGPEPVYRRNIEVYNGQILTGVDIMVPVMGKLRVRLDGFLEEDYQGLDTKRWYRNITLTITSRDGREMRWAIDSPSPFTLNLGCGTWGARLTANNLGTVERSMEVMHGMVSELTFFRTDLVPAQQ